MRRFLLLVLPAVLLAGCTHAPRTVSVKPKAAQPGQSFAAKDIQITQDIRRQLLADPDLSVNAKYLHVSSRDGRVMLVGAVDDQTERAKVKEIAAKVPGISGIEDHMEVLDTSIAAQKGSEVR